MHGPGQDDAGGPLQTPVVEEVKPEKTERARDGGPQRREGEAQTKWAGGRKAVGHGCATLRPPASGIWGTAFSGGGGGPGEGRNGTGVLLPTGLSRRLVRRRAAVELYLQRCRPFIVPLHRAERRPDALQRMSRSTGICTKRACLWARSASFRRPGWWAPRQQQSLAVSRLALFPAASPSHPKQHRDAATLDNICPPHRIGRQNHAYCTAGRGAGRGSRNGWSGAQAGWGRENKDIGQGRR